MGATRRSRDTGNITERGKGRWLLRTWHLDFAGKRKSRSKTVLDTKKKAEAEMRTLLDQVDSTRPSHRHRRGASNPTVKEYIEKWINSYCVTETNPRTARTYRDVLQRYLIPYCGRLKIRDLAVSTSKACTTT